MTNATGPFIPEKYQDVAYLRRSDLAILSEFSQSYFAHLYIEGKGPRAIKCGKDKRSQVLYPTRDFFEWLESLGGRKESVNAWPIETKLPERITPR